MVKILLMGGPPYLPIDLRVQRVSKTKVKDTFKLPYGAGYEHFRHRGEETHLNGELIPVMEWYQRTFIAE
ncbi:DUF5988 family protein [Nonomuraea rosea]|jgi:hypothetical protein|uniref:DUF5988 family protein n=1 Tax=Nonomuraea rosea TaxID=638574 RepID=A0ABP6XJ89_9ACTN